eukprot:15135663-Alexandrium_andersonii.AAC.1
MARAGERISEHLARQAQDRVEAAAAAAPRAGAASAQAQREQGEFSGRVEPVSAGARPSRQRAPS